MAGAYTSALLTDAGYSFFVGAIAAIAVSAIIGGLLAWPTKKLRQEYWAIVTLAAGEILRIFIKTETWLAGGTFGLSAPQPLEHLLPKNLYFLFFVIVGVTTVVLALFFLNYFTRTPLGRILRAGREDDDLPRAFGKDLYLSKAKAMIIGGALGGLAGCLFAHYMGYISPMSFKPLKTFIIWAMVIVGGTGNFLGVIIGTVCIQIFYNGTRFLSDFLPISMVTISSIRMMVIGLLIIVFMLYKPEGILKERKQTYEIPKD